MERVRATVVGYLSPKERSPLDYITDNLGVEMSEFFELCSTIFLWSDRHPPDKARRSIVGWICDLEFSHWNGVKHKPPIYCIDVVQ